MAWVLSGRHDNLLPLYGAVIDTAGGVIALLSPICTESLGDLVCKAQIER